MKQGWEIKKLGEVCDIINGFAFKSNLFTDEGEYILRISNIQNGYIDLTDIAHFNKTDYPKVNLEKYAVLEDDIVVSPGYYQYMKQAVEYYKDNADIAGISLYSHKMNVNIDCASASSSFSCSRFFSVMLLSKSNLDTICS